jgi:hypothetical protein
MADAVTARAIVNTPHLYAVHLTNVSDGTGEAAVAKIDKSALVASDGAEPASLDIVACRWAIQGFSSVRLLWDHTTDDTAMVLTGSGFENFETDKGDIRADAVARLCDPRSAGDTGDILLTTAGAVSGASYDITLWVRKASS